MKERRGLLWIITAVIFLIVLGLFFAQDLAWTLRPEPVAAYVGVRVEGSDTAVVGPVAVAESQDFQLHAILEVEGAKGETFFYTEAPALEIDGEQVSPERVRQWDRPEVIKVFWSTLEGSSAYMKLAEPAQIDRFEFAGFFQSEWPLLWSVSGRLGFMTAARGFGEIPPTFGTQRYAVRIELFDDKDATLPRLRVSSAGSAALPEGADQFPTVRRHLPGAVAEVSSVFGLTQIELGDPGEYQSMPPDLEERISTWTAKGIAFGRLPLLKRHLQAAGLSFGELEWQRVALNGYVPWGYAGVEPGDLLRAGSRLVILYRDLPDLGEAGADGASGGEGRLDAEDLCFDFVRGAAVRSLGEVFTGDGEVELAILGRVPQTQAPRPATSR